MEREKIRKFRYELIFLAAAFITAIFFTWALFTNEHEIRALCQSDLKGIMLSAVFLFIAVVVLASWAIRKIMYDQRIYAKELEARGRKMRELAITDGLTKVYNHRYFEHQLEKEWERHLRFGHALSCVMIDVDNFKQINDKYGHRGGDAVLLGLANLLRKNMREVDILSRYGGEEFTLILPEKPDRPQGLKAIMEKLCQKVQETGFFFEENEIKITVSLGGALVPNPKINSPEKLVHFADKAMYRAKDHGKNASMVFGERDCC